jgi:hypothetical protein
MGKDCQSLIKITSTINLEIGGLPWDSKFNLWRVALLQVVCTVYKCISESFLLTQSGGLVDVIGGWATQSMFQCSETANRRRRQVNRGFDRVAPCYGLLHSPHIHWLVHNLLDSQVEMRFLPTGPHVLIFHPCKNHFYITSRFYPWTNMSHKQFEWVGISLLAQLVIPLSSRRLYRHETSWSRGLLNSVPQAVMSSNLLHFRRTAASTSPKIQGVTRIRSCWLK